MKSYILQTWISTSCLLCTAERSRRKPESLASLKAWRLTLVPCGRNLSTQILLLWDEGPELRGDWAFQEKPHAQQNLALGAGGCVSWERDQWCLSQEEQSGPRRGRGKQPMWFSQESVGLDVGNPDFAQQLAQLEQDTQCLIVLQTWHRGKQTKDRIGPLTLLLKA